MRLKYDPGLSSALKDLVAEHIDAVAPILAPRWLAEIEVKQASDDANLAIAIEVDFAYRRACIWVYQGFALVGEGERRSFVIHEFCHLYTSPVKDMAMRMVDETWDKDSSSRKIWTNEFTVCLEGSTVDLENLIVRLLDGDDIPRPLPG